MWFTTTSAKVGLYALLQTDLLTNPLIHDLETTDTHLLFPASVMIRIQVK